MRPKVGKWTEDPLPCSVLVLNVWPQFACDDHVVGLWRRYVCKMTNYMRFWSRFARLFFHVPEQTNAICINWPCNNISLRHVPLCQRQWSCNVAKHHVSLQKNAWVAMPPWRPIPIYMKRHEPNHRSINLNARTHTKGEGQSRNCKASEIVRSKTWSRQNTCPFLFAKLLMKQQHWMLFTCSFDPIRPTWQNWKYYENIFEQLQLQLMRKSPTLQTQKRLSTWPALAHRVEEVPPESPSPTSQPEIIATHHGFALPQLHPAAESREIGFASCQWMSNLHKYQVHKHIK